ncbi:protein kinase [Streptomyces sp. MUM 203J]|nr:protein kinase [Streptomyces sp. MUM 203J]
MGAVIKTDWGRSVRDLVLGGRYRMLRPLGEGGMGQVWEARDETLERLVAVKVISLLAGGGSRGDDARARFLREARITAALQHPSIVTVHDLGEAEAGEGRTPFLVMELVRGEGLDAVLRRHPLALPQASRWGAQMADALGEAHAVGVLHRDIKPSNVLITASGVVKLLDFGIARAADPSATQGRLTQTGFIVGTPQYMAPEQARGHPGTYSDLYALGCVLFEMITGRLPFDAPDAMGHLTAHLTQEPPAPSSVATGVTPAWDELVLTLLRKEPDQRYGSAAEVAQTLRRLDQAAPAYAPTQVPAPAEPERRPIVPPSAAPTAPAPGPPPPVAPPAIPPVPVSAVPVPVPRRAFRTDKDAVAVAFCSGGRHMVYAMTNGTVVVIDHAGDEVHRIVHRTGWLESPTLAVSQDGALLATVRRKGWKWLRIWDAATGSERQGFDLGGSAHHLAFSPDGARIATAGGGWVHVWDTRTGERLLRARGGVSGPNDVTFSPDGRLLAVGGPRAVSCAVSVVDAASGSIVLAVPIKRIKISPGSLAFSPDGTRLALPVEFQNPSLSQGLCVVDTRSGGRLLDLDLGERIDSKLRVAFSPRGDWIATCGGREARLWDATSGELLSRIPPHTDPVCDLAFSPDGTMLVTAGADRTVRITDLTAPPGSPATPGAARRNGPRPR